MAKAKNPMRSKRKRFAILLGPHDHEYVDDDDFGWDIAIGVSGDFASMAAKRAFMRALVKVLNENEPKLPTRDSYYAKGER